MPMRSLFTVLAAKGQLRADSDVDIAYLSKKSLSAYERFMLAQRLADQLKREVDLIDLAESSTVLQAQIVSNGELLLDSEPYLRQVAYIVALKSYARLNEERAEIIRNLEARTGGVRVAREDKQIGDFETFADKIGEYMADVEGYNLA
ncbi:type VII toxin-antitoxin system MntA family adenylyltransferase antitoxin [Cohnella lubricantis]|uniref:type VII toxin-antitoxin system MntA family adenylyltransferase antitoxin n=1 Tax=Cohnella lubricantis TaxID=2163172 RepID=UPI001AE268F5|nr:nucleotidyltransferase domain-containing protein [Cohnella lubricantis]